MLPVKPVTLVLPPMKDVSSVKVSGTSISLDIIDNIIVPYQNPVPIGESFEDFVIDQSTYSLNSVYPDDLSDDFVISYSHGYTIFSVVLNPVQYNPV